MSKSVRGNREENFGFSEEELQILYLADVEGKPQEEIAKSLGISQSTVSRVLSSARHKLACMMFMQLQEAKEEVKKMKIAFATEKGGLDDMVSPVFARCARFTIVDDNGGVELVDNPGRDAPRGAAIAATQVLIDKGVGMVVAGSFGPHSLPVLQQAGIIAKQIRPMKVKEAIDAVKNDVASNPPSPPYFLPFGFGWGRGFGFGPRGFGRRCRMRRRWFWRWL